MTGIRILSTGSQQARQVVTNDDMARVVETNDEWIRTRTGIRQRRFAGEEESTTTLAVGAAREAVRALEEGGRSRQEIGAVLVATFTPSDLVPNTACLVQEALGLPEQLLVTLEGADAGFDLSEIALGDHLEVYYNPPAEEEGEACAITCYPVIAVNRLMPAEAVYYNGILTAVQEKEDGSVDLVMVPEGTAQDQWEDPMVQFVFHTGDETQFYCNLEDLTEGTLLNIYHKGIMTMSIPPQGVALEVRPITAE